MLQENTTRLSGTEIFRGNYIPPDVRQVRELEDLIEQHFREMRTPEFYSESLRITLSRLNTISRAHLGRSVYELLQDRLHEEAIKLLRYTTLSVKQIAYELGMSDPAYFFRCFKKITGMSPGEFRKSNNQLKGNRQFSQAVR